MNKINKKTNYKRNWKRIELSYISVPKLSRFAKSYSSCSNERYIYLYAYAINSNGEKSSNDFSYHAYSNKCDMSSKKIEDFTQYINKNFHIGEIVNAYVVTWKHNGATHRMITKITPANPDNSTQIVLDSLNPVYQNMRN